MRSRPLHARVEFPLASLREIYIYISEFVAVLTLSSLFSDAGAVGPLLIQLPLRLLKKVRMMVRLSKRRSPPIGYITTLCHQKIKLRPAH